MTGQETPADAATPIPDEWIERHVEKNLEWAHSSRLNAYMSGYGGKTLYDRLDRSAIREDLRKGFRDQLRAVVTDEQKELLASLGSVQNREWVRTDTNLMCYDTPEKQHNYEAQRQRDVDRWNTYWREYIGSDTRNLPPSLSGSSFNGQDLRGIDLTNFDLGQRPDLGWYGSKHHFCNLSNAILKGGNFCKNNFFCSRLDGADATDAYLRGAILQQAKCRGTDFSRADLRDADLTDADLTNAIFLHADLTGAKLKHATLDGADLRFSKGVLVDENPVYRTRFTNRASLTWRILILLNSVVERISIKLRRQPEWDRTPRFVTEDTWSALRRTYTGPNFFISLLFLVVFTVPWHASKALLLTELSYAEAAVFRTVSHATQYDARTPIDNHDALTTTSESLADYQSLMGELDAFTKLTEITADEATKVAAHPSPQSIAMLAESVDRILAQTRDIRSHATKIRRDIGAWVSAKIAERQFPIWKILLGIDTGHFPCGQVLDRAIARLQCPTLGLNHDDRTNARCRGSRSHHASDD